MRERGDRPILVARNHSKGLAAAVAAREALGHFEKRKKQTDLEGGREGLRGLLGELADGIRREHVLDVAHLPELLLSPWKTYRESGEIGRSWSRRRWELRAREIQNESLVTRCITS